MTTSKLSGSGVDGNSDPDSLLQWAPNSPNAWFRVATESTGPKDQDWGVHSSMALHAPLDSTSPFQSLPMLAPIIQRCLIIAALAWMTACTGAVSGGAAVSQSSDGAGADSAGVDMISESQISEGEDFAMHPGDSVALSGHGKLRYVRVVNDSRCKPGVQCIWAGNAELAFEWNDADAGKQSFSLNTTVGDKYRDLGDRRLSLLSLAMDDTPEARMRLDATP